MLNRQHTGLLLAVLFVTGMGSASLGQGVPPGMRAPAAPIAPGVPGAPGFGGVPEEGLRLKFSMTPLDIVLQDYSEKTGKTLLRAPGLPTPTFTLRSQGELSIDEYLSAVETVLSMHGIGLVATGEKFVRVVPIKNVRREPMEIKETLTEGLLSEDSGELISQMIVLKHIDIAEATKAVEVLRHEYGQVNAFERTNSILVTDTAGNINRMLQVLRFIDQPIEAREEPSIIQIRHAKASDIKGKLEEIIKASQEDEQKSTVPQAKASGAPGVVRSVPGVIRARTATPPSVSGTPTPASATLIEEAERGIIRGKVQIVADERTNKLIILTRPENMTFFKMIVDVLDIETSPDVEVKVVRLEFAEAEEIAGMLNDLIGATEEKEAPAVAKAGGEGEGAEAKALREYVDSIKQPQPAAAAKSSVGELSKDNIKILSDERTNALIIMASKGDLATLLDIVDDMDMMLSQVLIEAVIIDVDLSDSLNTGVSWIQKSLTSYEKNSAGRRTPVASFAGGGGGDTSGFGTPRDAAVVSAAELSTSGLGYFFTIFDLNINAVLEASAGDSRTRVVSTPALLTTDNTEAKLSSTEKIYVFEGTTYYGGNYGGTTTGTSNYGNNSARYRQEDIGLELTVKPHINENHVVMMEISQKISQPGDQSGTTDNLAGQVISKDRTIEASIAVRSGQTIVLGGQVRDSSSRSRTKIPLLGDIPLLGRLFNSDSRNKGRTETIVFITPYVLDSPEQVAEETRRRRDALNIEGMWKQGWSGSEMAEPPDKRWWQRSPKPRASRKELSWETSNGKSARGHEESLPAPEDIGGDETRRPASDIDDFLREQRTKWEQALEEAGGETN